MVKTTRLSAAYPAAGGHSAITLDAFHDWENGHREVYRVVATTTE